MKKYIIGLIAIAFLFVGCGQSSEPDSCGTQMVYDPGCHSIPDGEPQVFCNGDSIHWDCTYQEAYVNDRIEFHYSDDGCCDAVIKYKSSDRSDERTDIKSISLERDE